LAEIEKSAEKAAEIANDLANFSRQEKETRQTTGNLNELLQRTVEAFRTPENAQITWDLQLERKLFSFPFDEAKMQQAFAKIIENSVQAIAAGGQILIASRNFETDELVQDGTVKLGPGTYVCAEIADNGSGISPEALPRIFEPFFTTKGKNHRGLGLAWVYGIITNHDGIITNHGGGVAISSEPGAGTSARVYLPAVKKVIKETSLASDDLCGIETILVVDDEDLLLNMTQTVLSSFGYRALVANSGQKALEVLSEEPVDLVITDLVMPGMSGRELMERIRMVAPGTRIICSSGYVRPGSKEEDNYLQKPFTAQELLRRVKQVLTSEQFA
jgi:CheY-like chemotaxis protein